MERKPIIVSVDDNRLNLLLIESMLESQNYVIESFTSPQLAIDRIKEIMPDLILTDYMMPEIDGISFTKMIRSIDVDVPIVMITAVDDDDNVKISALNAGASDFLYKPLKLYEFQVRVKNLLTMRKNQLLLKDRAALLMKEVEDATELIRLREYETLSIIGRASEYKDMETGFHIQRVANYCREISKTLGMDSDFIDLIYYSSPLHDIGKIGIPDNILQKPGRLTPAEFVIMQQHTTIGEAILSDTQSKYLLFGSRIAASHHEKWDGSGYPRKLKGDDIPICGRIVAVSDVFDALMSKRPYKEAWAFEDTCKYIGENSGTAFDPEVISVFIKIKETMREIRFSYDD